MSTMAPLFTFVNVELNEENRRLRSRARAISAEDNVRIRSIAAACPWNRQRIREEDSAGIRGKDKAKSATKKVPKPTSFKHGGLDQMSLSRKAVQSGNTGYHQRLSDVPSENLISWNYGSDAASEEESNDTEDEVLSRNPLDVPTESQRPITAIPKQQAQPLSSVITKFLSDLPAYVKTGRIDPFWAFPVPYSQVLSTTMSYNLVHLCPPHPVLDIEFQEKASVRFWRISRDEPAFLFAQALFSAKLMCITGVSGKLGTPIQEKHLFWLKGCTFNALNKAFQKQKKTSADIDALVGALIVLITYEQCFGEESIRNMHVQALGQLLSGRESMSYSHRRMIEWECRPRDYFALDNPCQLLDIKFQEAAFCVADAVGIPR